MILIFSNASKKLRGGLEIFNEELESLLDNNDVQYFRSPSIISLKIFDYAFRTLHSLYYILINFNKIDFILVQHGNMLDVLVLPLLKLSTKPIRIISHVGNSWKHVNNTILNSLTNFILKCTIQKIYIISDEQRSFLRHHKIKKIHTVINKKYVINEKYHHVDKKYILFLGRVCPEKGIEDLIAVFSELKSVINIPDLKIVGPLEEGYKKLLNKLIADYKIKEYVSISEPVYDIDKKIELIDNATILVYPSYSDAFPLTVIESFARGKACLATAISETKNFIEFDDFLFVPGNTDELKNKLQSLILNKNNLYNKISYMQKKSMKYATGAIINDIF